MPRMCIPIQMPDGVVGRVTVDVRPRRAKCAVCREKVFEFECDGFNGRRKSGTCDRRLCADCTQKRPPKVEGGEPVDLCPECVNPGTELVEHQRPRCPKCQKRTGQIFKVGGSGTRVFGGRANLYCDPCNVAWAGDDAALALATKADAAVERRLKRTGPKLTRAQREAQRTNEQLAKLERLKAGKW